MHSSCNHEPRSHHLRRLPCAILKFHLKAKRTRKSRTCKKISYIGSHILSPLYIPTVYLIHNCHPVDENHFEFICKRLVFYVFFILYMYGNWHIFSSCHHYRQWHGSRIQNGIPRTSRPRKKNLPSANLQQHGSRRSTDPQRDMGAALDTLRQGEAEWAAGAVSRKGAGKPRTSQTRLDDVTAIPAS